MAENVIIDFGIEDAEATDSLNNFITNLNKKLESISTRDIVKGLGDISQGLNSIGNAVKGISPDLDQGINKFQDMAKSAQDFARLGSAFGPEGALVGAIIGALIPALTEASKAEKQFEEAIAHATEASGQQGEALLRQQIRQMEQTSHTWDLDLNTRIQAERNLAQARQALAVLEEENNNQARARARAAQLAADTQRTQDQQASAYRLLVQQQQAEQRAREEKDRDIEQSEHQEETHQERLRQQRIAAGQRETERLRREYAARLESEMDTWAQEEEEWQKHIRALDATQPDLNSWLSEMAAGRDQAAADLQGSLHDLDEILDADNKKKKEKQAQAAKDLMNAVASPVGQATQAFAQGIGTAVVAALEGKESFDQALKEMAKSTLESLTQQSITQAIWETAQGLAALATAVFSYGANAGADAAAGLHFAAAGTYAAIAGVAGGALAAVSAGGNSGPNVGGSTTNSPSNGSGGFNAQNAGAINNTQNVNIYVNSPNLLTLSDVGRNITKARDAFARNTL